MHANQEMFTAEMQELFGILQSNNIFNHSNSLKKKKSCDHLNWYRENWKQFNNHTEENIYALWIDGKLPQLHKEDLKISTVHFAFNGEKWTAVPPKFKNKATMSTLTTPGNLSRCNKARKENHRCTDENGINTTCLSLEMTWFSMKKITNIPENKSLLIRSNKYVQ